MKTAARKAIVKWSITGLSKANAHPISKKEIFANQTTNARLLNFVGIKRLLMLPWKPQDVWGNTKKRTAPTSDGIKAIHKMSQSMISNTMENTAKVV